MQLVVDPYAAFILKPHLFPVWNFQPKSRLHLEWAQRGGVIDILPWEVLDMLVLLSKQVNTKLLSYMNASILNFVFAGPSAGL